jgi:deoxyribose-phosphate aldolase
VLKVILETSPLNIELITKATELAIEVGTDFVKTSTGFAGGGATDEAIKAMLTAAKGRIGVKPAGGVRDFKRAQELVEMGCRRLGVGYASTPLICSGVLEQMPKEAVAPSLTLT